MSIDVDQDSVAAEFELAGFAVDMDDQRPAETEGTEEEYYGMVIDFNDQNPEEEEVVKEVETDFKCVKKDKAIERTTKKAKEMSLNDKI